MIQDGVLKEVVLIHVDDFSVDGIEEFLERILAEISETLRVSKTECDIFPFKDLDILYDGEF